MPRFDIPGRKGPMKAIRYRDGREYIFDLPCEVTDPIEIEILASDPLTQEVVVVVEESPAVFEPLPEITEDPVTEPFEVKPLKPSRKEV